MHFNAKPCIFFIVQGIFLQILKNNAFLPNTLCTIANRRLVRSYLHWSDIGLLIYLIFKIFFNKEIDSNRLFHQPRLNKIKINNIIKGVLFYSNGIFFSILILIVYAASHKIEQFFEFVRRWYKKYHETMTL